LLPIPQIAFAFCHLASHFGLDFIDEDSVNSVMEFIVSHQGDLLARTKLGQYTTMPILHFHPAAKFLQISTMGCNFDCPAVYRR
jgi:cell division FtsZ-interacting protein ZapD